MAEGVIVAVIDSGVHPDHPHIDAACLLPGAGVALDGTLVEEAMPLDRLGHGTAVTAAVQEKAPEAMILPIRVFHEALTTSALALSTAIGFAAARGAHIINLSLGTTNVAHRALFAAAAQDAANALLVAAAEAPGEHGPLPCLPGSLGASNVLPVGFDWDIPRDHYRREAGCLIASGYPRPIEGVPPRRNLYGISFAVAQASGFAARAAAGLGVVTPPALIAALG